MAPKVGVAPMGVGEVALMEAGPPEGVEEVTEVGLPLMVAHQAEVEEAMAGLAEAVATEAQGMVTSALSLPFFVDKCSSTLLHKLEN